MFREPRKTETTVEPHNERLPRRFQIDKLEERIAPLCSLFKVTPSGKLIWHCSHSKLA